MNDFKNDANSDHSMMQHGSNSALGSDNLIKSGVVGQYDSNYPDIVYPNDEPNSIPNNEEFRCKRSVLKGRLEVDAVDKEKRVADRSYPMVL